LSRLRKKMYVEELEKKIKDLEDDKKRLEEKVTELTEIINNGNMSNNTFNNNSNTVNSNGSSSNNNAARKLGVFFLILFSFGIFLKTQNKEEDVGMKYLPSPGGSRVLQELVSPEAETVSLQKVAVVAALPSQENLSSEMEPKNLIVKHQQKNKVRIQEETVLSRDLEITKKRLSSMDRTNFLYCPNPEHIQTNKDSDQIALLLPTRMLNNTNFVDMFRQNPGFDSSLLEVSCSVMNIHMWPFKNTDQVKNLYFFL